MKDRIDIKGLLFTVAAAVLLAVCWFADFKILTLVAGGALIAIVIWQACDPFAEAAQWVGKAFHIPGSVRGATLDAVASSMPELFSGIFFVLFAIQLAAAGDQAPSEDAIRAAGGEGFGSTIATCAGSAVYNMVLIPAAATIAVSLFRRSQPTIDIEREVLTRDGMWFLMCQMILIGFLYQDTMHWWMGVVFLLLYCGYIFQLFTDAKNHRRVIKAIDKHFNMQGPTASTRVLYYDLKDHRVKVTWEVVERRRLQLIGEAADDDDEDAEAPDSTPALFGLLQIPINRITAPLILLVCTAVAAFACYWLVKITHGTAELLEVPTFFVAVILAAAVSSVPDTFLSIGAAMRGDDSGAVSNAFGSNIFDICVCLSIPLLVSSYLTGWQPVAMVQINEAGQTVPLTGLTGLRILLAVLTVITLIILWHNKQLTRFKAFILIGLYLVFLGYAVLGSLGVIAV